MNITMNGKTMSFQAPQKLKAIVEAMIPERTDEVLACFINRSVIELNAEIYESAELYPITYANEEGRRIYERSMRFVLLIAALVAAVREVETAMGNGRLTGPSELEAAEMYRNARRSVVAAAEIPAGTTITAEMLTVKRPGYGIAPKHLDLVVGRVAKVDVPFDEIVTWDMV